MPFAVLKSIREVSSEDKVHCAANLLNSDSVKKWKTGEIGEKTAYVIIEMETAYTIKGIDIGNESSAFVEVLVGGSTCTRENFKEILITCSFMTPAESKGNTNTNRVRCFNREALVKEVADEKWNLLKVVCTQPFNKHTQYGLSFIKVHVEEAVERKKSIDSNGSSSLPKHTLGGFTVRDNSPDSESETSVGLFRRWKTAKTTDLTGTSSIPRTPSTSVPIVNHKKAITPSSSTQNSESKVNAKVPDRNRDSLLFGDNDDSALEGKQKKKLEKLESIIQEDKERLKKEMESAKKSKKRDSIGGDEQKPNKQESSSLDRSQSKKTPSKPSTPSQKYSSSDTPVRKTPSSEGKPSTSSQRRPSSSPCDAGVERKKPKLEKVVKYKPFHQLLRGVVLVISGIQNPDRANLRTKALALGASYKPDWDNSSTHLICAFKNTPKYNQVKGHGKIVTRKWIEDCHAQKKRLPWRRYALDTAEQSAPESDEEILDESLKPKERTPSPPPKHRESSDIEAIYDNDVDQPHHSLAISSDCDTEDEIERALASTSAKKKTPQKRDIYDLTTEEEEYTSKLKNSLTFFADKKFYVSDQLSSVERMKVEQCIETYHGDLVKSVAAADFVIANKPVACGTSFTGEIVKPLWVLECNDSELFIPTKRYLVT